MGIIIESGNSGAKAFVSKAGRLRTQAVTEEQNVVASINGNTFFISSGIINVTSGNLSEIIFIRNTDTVDWVVDEITTTFGPSTDAPGLDFSTTATINPTGGTIIDNGAELFAGNLNLGSPNILSGVFRAGFEGATATGGIAGQPGLILSDKTSTFFDAGPVIIAPGTSASIGVTPATGNTSMNLDIVVVVYRQVDEG